MRLYIFFQIVMDKKFSFHFLESGFKLSSDHNEFLMKWGLDRSLSRHKFTFDQTMQMYEIENFMSCLFKDQSVAATIGIAGLVRTLLALSNFEPSITVQLPFQK